MWRIRAWGPVPGAGAVWTVQEFGFYIAGCAETAFDTSEVLTNFRNRPQLFLCERFGAKNGTL